MAQVKKTYDFKSVGQLQSKFQQQQAARGYSCQASYWYSDAGFF
jgi:hypothetical protein